MGQRGEFVRTSLKSFVGYSRGTYISLAASDESEMKDEPEMLRHAIGRWR